MRGGWDIKQGGKNSWQYATQGTWKYEDSKDKKKKKSNQTSWGADEEPR